MHSRHTAQNDTVMDSSQVDLTEETGAAAA